MKIAGPVLSHLASGWGGRGSTVMVHDKVCFISRLLGASADATSIASRTDLDVFVLKCVNSIPRPPCCLGTSGVSATLECIPRTREQNCPPRVCRDLSTARVLLDWTTPSNTLCTHLSNCFVMLPPPPSDADVIFFLNRWRCEIVHEFRHEEAYCASLHPAGYQVSFDFGPDRPQDELDAWSGFYTTRSLLNASSAHYDSGIRFHL